MNREEAIKVLSSYDVNGVWADVDGKPYNAEEQAEAFDMAIEALKTEIVRCKDCKHYDEGGFCWHPAAEVGDTLATEPTDSCRYGERSEEK